MKHPEPAADKTEFRKMMLKRQSELDDDYVASAGRSIEAQVLSLDAFKNAKSIFVYVNTEKEPSTRRIIDQALLGGKAVYIPKCVSKTEMLAVRISDTESLLPGKYGIPEPPAVTETKTAEELDLIIVPCVAASEDGRRLGHGAGYYDRFLKGSSGNAVCLCFSEMTEADIPACGHDILIPTIITD